MFKLNYDEIVEKIIKEKGISKEEIDVKIKKKLELLSDLISKEGAAHIVANELGVKVFEENIDRKLKINKVMPGMSMVNLDVKVIDIYDVRSFKTEKREGKVVNLMVGDDTGMLRLVLWDESLIKLIEDGNIKQGDILRINNGYSRENNGYSEVHLGNKAKILINPEGVVIDGIKAGARKSLLKKQIKDLKENENAEIVGTVVQLFDPRFYSACPECNKKVEFIDGSYKCGVHGEIVAKDVPILNMFLDDGTENIRIVCFRDIADNVLNNQSSKFKELPSEFESFKNELLGKQYRVSGKVVRNAMFDRLEFIANSVDEINASDYADEIVKEAENEMQKM
ncbi:MAG TPA: hypothetical protein VJJ23_02175 [Candidatus Nanoarchaeia archaeon]|nr:hypothetical protein [Candidatus Nanoarchaeia archaeon]